MRIATLLFFVLVLTASAQIVQFSGALIVGCSAGVLDTFAASPGSWTVGYSLRKVRAAYGGSALQLQRTSDNTTQDVGFGSNCSPDTAVPTSFCSTTSLAVTTSSARVAFPSGTTIGVTNTSANQAYYKAGNSSVTAATSDTFLPPGGTVSVTVGANTHVAGITNNGSSAFSLTNCRVRTFYDQVNANNQVQTTQGNQPFYRAVCSINSLPCLAWCSTCGMSAADNASYKTDKIHAFAIHQFGLDTFAVGNAKQLIGYPFNTSSDALAQRWGLLNESLPDVLNIQLNASSTQFLNGAGFGAIYRNNLYQYEVLTSDGLIRFFNVQFLGVGAGTTLTYPNAVGLYYGMDAVGGSNNYGSGAEVLIASDTQTASVSISSNQAAYWGVTAPNTSQSTADGFTYTAKYIGTFAPTGSYEVVNGRNFATESAGSSYSLWAANNVKTSGTTSLGDMYRFEVRQWDNWDGTNRSELSGTPAMSLDTIYYLSYCFQVESGSDVVSTIVDGGQAAWNIPGQAHGVSGSIAAPFFFSLSGNKFSVIKDNVNVYNSASNFVTFGTWIDIFVKVRKSTAGATDMFDVYFNGLLVYTCSGACFNTNTGTLYWKYGIYRGDVGNIVGTQTFRYANMQLTTTDISAQIAAPLDHPTHN